jgi:hypothetical protein
VGDAELDQDSSTLPENRPSGWAFDWRGLVVVVLVVTAAVIIWRWSSSSQPDDSSDGFDTASSEPIDSIEEVAPGTTIEEPTTTTGPPRTTAARSATTTATSRRRVVIRGERKPCRFGDDCLVASFGLDGFDEHSGTYSCIYADSRSDFTFNLDLVADACFTADDSDTITIEVDGVRSATISKTNLDGT